MSGVSKHLRDGPRVGDGAYQRRQHAGIQQRRVVLQVDGQAGQQRDRALALSRRLAAQIAHQALQRGCTNDIFASCLALLRVRHTHLLRRLLLNRINC